MVNVVHQMLCVIALSLLCVIGCKSYYVVYGVITLFLMNIIVNFIIVKFENQFEFDDERCIQLDLDKNQLACLNFALEAKPLWQCVPKGPFQNKLWQFTSSICFEIVVFLMVLLNTVAIGLKHLYTPSSDFGRFLDTMILIFLCIFTTEAFLKMLVLKPKKYFEDNGNAVDFFIVFGLYIAISFGEATHDFRIPCFILSFMFCMARVVKLMNRNEFARNVLWTICNTVQPRFYVAFFASLILLIYTFMGVKVIVFSMVGIEDCTKYDENTIFNKFFSAVLLPFRSVAEESWPYVISILVLCTFVITNACVAVKTMWDLIIDNFDYITRDGSILGCHHLLNFISLWSEFDPTATGRIKHEHLMPLLRKSDPPLGFGKLCPYRTCCRRLGTLNMPQYFDGTVGFNATLLALVRHSLSIYYDFTTRMGYHEKNEQFRTVLWEVCRNAEIVEEVLPRPGSNGIIMQIYRQGI